jgi:hypothetical protein
MCYYYLRNFPVPFISPLMILILRVSKGDRQFPTTWENKGKLKEKGQQERQVGREKGGKGGGF